MKKLSKKQRLIILVATILVAIILVFIITTNIEKNNRITSEDYLATTANASSNLVASYIKEGVTIGGITGTLEVLDTSDATAKPEEMIKGKTAYVKGKKITGTYVTREMLKIGDYIDYTPNGQASYSIPTSISGFESDQTINRETNIKWRVISVNQDGTVDLISSTATNATVGLKAGVGYNNGVYILDDMCNKLYGNISLNAKARNLKISDLESHYSTEGKSVKTTYVSNGGIKYGNTKTYTDKRAYYPLLYKREIGAGINTTQVNKTGVEVNEQYYSEPTSENVELASNRIDNNTNILQYDKCIRKF